MSKQLESRITQMTILPKGEPIFCDGAIKLTIDDEAGGEFLLVNQQCEGLKPGEIYIDPAHWSEIKSAIDKMISEIENHGNK